MSNSYLQPRAKKKFGQNFLNNADVVKKNNRHYKSWR